MPRAPEARAAERDPGVVDRDDPGPHAHAAARRVYRLVAVAHGQGDPAAPLRRQKVAVGDVERGGSLS